MAKLSVEQALTKAKYHMKKGELAEARTLYAAILKAFPNNKKAQQAQAVLGKAEQRNTNQGPPPEIRKQLVKSYEQGQFIPVVEQAQALTKLYPEALFVWFLLGVGNKGLGRDEEASIAFKKVTELDPQNFEGHNNLGTSHAELGRFDKAIASYNKALSIKPDYVEAYSNMGNALQAQDKLKEAIASYDKALSIKPDYVEAYSNMGNALQAQGKLKEAIASHNKAISLKPDSAKAHKGLCSALLSYGKLKEGLDEYEWRWKTPRGLLRERHFSQPLWDGKKSLEGKRILLWHEQGIGDTINWSSCIPLVANQAQHCTLECPEKLIPLLAQSFPNVEIKPENKNLDSKRDDFDFHLPMGSLYKHFIPKISQNAESDAFLIVDPVRVNFWRERLKSLGKGPYVGVGWKSSNMSVSRLQNYAPVSEWSPVFMVSGVTFVNLQYEDFADDLSKIQKEFGVTVHNFNDLDHYNNLVDVAALCSALDMVVSVKMTVPLISAGVGTPTKLANWRQSEWNNTLLNPVGSSVDIFERNTWEPWGKVFCLIADDIVKLKNNPIRRLGFLK
ncbi:tetratricopeptide repeat protein [Planktomarina temperata]|nr:tetratricopeptide repeat protein [Planktomarina temperata]